MGNNTSAARAYTDSVIIRVVIYRVYRLCCSKLLSNFHCHFIFRLHGKNDYEESKILLDINLKIILLDYENNFVGT